MTLRILVPLLVLALGFVFRPPPPTATASPMPSPDPTLRVSYLVTITGPSVFDEYVRLVGADVPVNEVRSRAAKVAPHLVRADAEIRSLIG